MSKTKIIIIISAAIVAAALIALGVKFAGKPDDDSTTEAVTTTAAATTQASTTIPTDIPIGDYTTLKPFVDAQTEIIIPDTTVPTTTAPISNQSSTASPAEEEEHATQIDSANGWKNNDLTLDLPKINASSITTNNYITDKGYRTVIRIENFDYNSYLAYIDRLEDAGFNDNNNRKHIPSTAPETVAMFYSKFDGERSFGVYWHGDKSSAEFDCEIVICDYDQAK